MNKFKKLSKLTKVIIDLKSILLEDEEPPTNISNISNIVDSLRLLKLEFDKEVKDIVDYLNKQEYEVKFMFKSRLRIIITAGLEEVTLSVKANNFSIDSRSSGVSYPYAERLCKKCTLVFKGDK